MSYHLTTGNDETLDATFDDRADAQSAADDRNGHFEVVFLPARLTADVDANSVEDEDGGVWWPGEDAQDQIARALDPRAEAVRICREDPACGVWLS